MTMCPTCRALQQGLAAYSKDLPPTYAEADHKAALRKALQVFQVHARGPASTILEHRLKQAKIILSCRKMNSKSDAFWSISPIS